MLLSTALKDLLLQLENHKIPVVLIGGLAVNSYGYSRQTRDVDFLLATPHLLEIKKIMRDLGYSILVEHDLFIRFQKADLPIKAIDFVLADTDTFDSVMDQKKIVKIADIEFCVPSLHHLIAMKIHAIKNSPEIRKHKDMADIVELIQKNSLNTKSNDFQSLCLKYGTEDIYKELSKV